MPVEDRPRGAAKVAALVTATVTVTMTVIIGVTHDPAAPTPAPAPTAAPTPAGELVEVVRVIDGDTVRVRGDGDEFTLRLIGLDTPETVHPTREVECYGPEASAEAKRLLPVGAKLRIHPDPTQDTTDRYGRRLVYLTGPAGLDFAHHMIAMGYGHEYRYRSDYQRMGTYRAAEAGAEESDRGLWGACPH